MHYLLSWSFKIIDRLLTIFGTFLLLAGVVTGWVIPHLSSTWPLVTVFRVSVISNSIDTSTFLTGDLTTLAVIIAVLIGYNVAALQIAGQMLSLAFVRAILFSLSPFFLWWLIASGVAFVYLVIPPIYMGQIWQIVLWFGAIALLMIEYLWSIPQHLSADYAARWSVRDLRHLPIESWEQADGYSTLQTGISSALTRSDISSMRTMSITLGTFLSGVCDPQAEKVPSYQRGRFRTLKNLLSGCAHDAHNAPNAASYHLGYIASGVLLQVVAIGQPITYEGSDLYSGLIRSLQDDPDKIEALWTGLRHSLFRKGMQGDPYILQFWHNHYRWSIQDPRWVVQPAAGIARLHLDCWLALRATLPSGEADAHAADMLRDLYKYLYTYLMPVVHQKEFLQLPLKLLEALHTEVNFIRQNNEHISPAILSSLYRETQEHLTY